MTAASIGCMGIVPPPMAATGHILACPPPTGKYCESLIVIAAQHHVATTQSASFLRLHLFRTSLITHAPVA